MPFVVQCLACGQKQTVDREVAGNAMLCQHCQTPLPRALPGRRGRGLFLAGLATVVLGVLGTGGYFVWKQTEEKQHVAEGSGDTLASKDDGKGTDPAESGKPKGEPKKRPDPEKGKPEPTPVVAAGPKLLPREPHATLQDFGSDPVTVAFSPDGKRLAVGLKSGAVNVYDAVSLNLTAEIPVPPPPFHKRSITCLLFLPDGNTLATGHLFGPIAMIDLGTKTWTFFKDTRSGFASRTKHLALTPDGKTLVAQEQYSAALFDVAQKQHVRAINRPQDRFRESEYSDSALAPDGLSLAMLGKSEFVIRHLSDMKPLSAALTPRRLGNLNVSAPRFTRDGKYLLWGTQPEGEMGSCVRVWDVAGKKPRPEVAPDEDAGAIRQFAVAPDGRLLALAMSSREVQFWDALVPGPRGTLPMPGEVPHFTTFDHDGKRFCGIFGKEVRFWEMGRLGLDEAKPRQVVVHDPKAGLLDVKPRSVLRQAHHGAVTAIVFSHDGKSIFTGSHNGTVRRWDADAPDGIPEERSTSQDLRPPVYGLAVAPKDAFLMAALPATAVRVDARTFQTYVGAIQGKDVADSSCLPAVRILPSGGTHIALLADGTVGTLISENFRGALKKLEHPQGTRGIAVTPEGEILITCGGDNTLRLWNTATGAELGVLPGDETDKSGSARARGPLALSPDGNRLVAQWRPDLFLVYSMTSRKQLAPLRILPTKQPITAAVFAPDNRTLALTCRDGTLHFYDVPTRSLRGVIAPASIGEKETSPRHLCAAFSPDGKLLAVGCRADLHVYDLKSIPLRPLDESRLVKDDDTPAQVPAFTGDNPRTPIKRHRGALVKVAYSGDGKTIYSASPDGQIRSWDAATLKEKLDLDLPGKTQLRCLAVARDESKLAVSYGQNETRMFDLTTKEGTLVEPHRPGSGEGRGYVEFGPEGKTLAVIMDRGYPNLFSADAFLWETRAKTRLNELGFGVRAIRYSADGRTRVSTHAQNSLLVENLGSSASFKHYKADTAQKEDHRVMPETGMLVVASDGMWTASLWQRVELRRWNLEKQTQLEPILLGERNEFRRAQPTVMALHPDDRLLALGYPGRTIDFYDLPTGKKRGSVTVSGVKNQPGRLGLAVRDLAFSPDGKSLCIALDQAPILWDVAALPLEKLEGVPVVEKPPVKDPSKPKPGERVLPVPTTIALDADKPTTVQGALGTNDLMEEGQRYRLFLLPLLGGKTYLFDLHSKEFDGHLRLLTPRGDFLASDDDSGGQRNARLRLTPQYDGLFRLQVTGNEKDAKGSFTLTAQRGTEDAPTPKLDLKSEEIQTGESFRPIETKFANGLTAHTFLVAKDRKYRGDVFWSDDGKTITVLDNKGTLRRINVQTWTEEKRLELKEKCNNLALCRVGWLVSAHVQYGELYVLDRTSFALKEKLNPPSLVRVASAPNLDVAITSIHVDAFRDRADEAPADDKGSLFLMPLTGDRFPKGYDRRSVRGLTVSPDGQYVFVQTSGNGVRRYKLNGKLLSDGDGMDGIAPGATQIGFSADSRYWWLPAPQGNVVNTGELWNRLNEKSHSTFIWRTGGPTGKPEFIVPAGPGSRTASINPKTGDFYVHDRTRQLIVVGRNGQNRAELSLAAKEGDNDPLEFRPSPDGKKLLIRFENRLTLVDLAALDAPSVKRPAALDHPQIQRVLFARAGKYEYRTYLSGTDRVPGETRLGRVLYLTLEQFQLVKLELETSERVIPQIEIHGPEGTLLAQTKANRSFGSSRTNLQHLAEVPGVYKVVITSRDGEGQGPFNCRIGLTGKSLAAHQVLPLVPPPLPQSVSEPLKAAPLAAVGNLKATTLALPTQPTAPLFRDRLLLSADGKALFLVDDEGALLRINVATWTVERKLPAGGRISSIALSSLGLVAQMGNTEVWLIEPTTLTVTRQFEAPGMLEMTASPGSPLVVLTIDSRAVDHSALYGEKENSAKVLDLKRGEYVVQPARGHYDYVARPTLSPVGTHFLKIGIHAYNATQGSIGWSTIEKGEIQGKGYYSIPLYPGIRPGVTPDGKLVYMHHDGTTWGTEARVSPPYVLPFFVIGQKNQNTPVLELKFPVRPRAVAFDAKANFILVGHANQAVQIYDWKGKLLAERDLGPRIGGSKSVSHNEVMDLTVLPEGGKAVARFVDRLVLVDYSDIPGSTLPPPAEPVPEEKPPTTPLPADLGKVTAGPPVKEGNLTCRTLEVWRTTGASYCWDREGKYVFVAEQRGVLHRVRLDGFVDEAQMALGHQLGAMAWTAEGLVVRATTSKEILLIDPEKLSVRAKLSCPRGMFLVASPSAASLLVSGQADDEVYLFDLKQRKLLARGIDKLPTTTRSLRYGALSPDGKYAFFYGGDRQLHRIKVEENRLVHDAALVLPTPETYSCAVSPDGKFVCCFPHFQLVKDHSPVVVYPIESWEMPVFTWKEHLRLVTFDQKGNLIGMPRNADVRGKSFKYFAAPLKTDTKGTEYPWGKGTISAIRPHPQGQGLLITVSESGTRSRTTTVRTYYVVLPESR